MRLFNDMEAAARESLYRFFKYAHGTSVTSDNRAVRVHGDGSAYDPLPGMEPGCFHGGRPDMGAVQHGHGKMIDMHDRSTLKRSREGGFILDSA